MKEIEAAEYLFRMLKDIQQELREAGQFGKADALRAKLREVIEGLPRGSDLRITFIVLLGDERLKEEKYV